MPLYFDFFHGPLTEDVEELLGRFQLTDSVRFAEFCAIWREMRFPEVFAGITRMGEQKRFNRITLATAVKYFLPPYSYQIRVGGLYLVFAFYHSQLGVPPVKVRLALKDWPAVQKFIEDSVDSGHQDVVYVYQKLVAIKAIHYTAMPHVLTFRKQRKPQTEQVCAEFLGRTTAVQDLFSSDLVEELSNIQSQYVRLKEATVEVGSQVNTIQQNLPTSLMECMSGFITWQQKTFSQEHKDRNSEEEEEEDGEEKPDKDASSSRAKLLSSIKQKSFQNVQEAARSRRHRQPQAMEPCSSEPEQAWQATRRSRRPESLRARTRRSLRVTDERSKVHAWLLCAPEKQEKMPDRRINQTPPDRP